MGCHLFFSQQISYLHALAFRTLSRAIFSHALSHLLQCTCLRKLPFRLSCGRPCAWHVAGACNAELVLLNGVLLMWQACVERRAGALDCAPSSFSKTNNNKNRCGSVQCEEGAAESCGRSIVWVFATDQSNGQCSGVTGGSPNSRASWEHEC